MAPLWVPLASPILVLQGQLSARPIGVTDPMIAAIAIEQGLELVTGNTAHFQRVQQHGYPLTLIDWRI
jgi:tRNA(fMet)-specific endonuclease VapC